ncbi:hypothetical protein DOC35_19310 [Salmonella enterica subsp. enterica]|nr:hypothetical protein [Salmonella enterica subsp. enterica]
MPGEKSDPLRLVFSVTLEKQDFEVKLTPSQERPIVQIAMSGEVLDVGVVFTNMEAAHDQAPPAEMFEIIENLFPMIGQALRDVRTGKRKPHTSEQRWYDNDTGERVDSAKPVKLDS